MEGTEMGIGKKKAPYVGKIMEAFKCMPTSVLHCSGNHHENIVKLPSKAYSISIVSIAFSLFKHIFLSNWPSSV